jgi:chromate transporter
MNVSRADLFLAFAKIGLLGFGGVAPWARHVIVTEKRWLDEREYVSLLGVGQVLPGPNTINLAIFVGDRFQGGVGAVISLLSLLCVPITVLIGIALIYGRIAGLPAVDAAMAAGAAAAAGLVIGTALKMAIRLRLQIVPILIGLTAFGAVGLLHLPMVLAILVLAPISIGIAWWRRR